jgi:hypothetical protein
MDNLNPAIEDLRRALEEAECALEEAEECGDLEERLNSIIRLEDARSALAKARAYEEIRQC